MFLFMMKAPFISLGYCRQHRFLVFVLIPFLGKSLSEAHASNMALP